MNFFYRLTLTKRRPIMIGLFLLAFIAGRPLAAMATENDRGNFQDILQASLIALWTGEEFSPELKQRQQTVKAMLSAGTVTKATLESMFEKTIPTLLNGHQTSRYVLNDISEPFNALFSPYLNWDAAKAIIWRVAASPIQANEPLLFKIASLAPPATPWLNVPATTVLPEIENMTDGKFLFKIYGGGVMGEDPDVLRQMGEGRLDSCGCTAVGVVAASPEASVLLLPGLFNNYDEVDYICKKFRKTLDRAFEKNGYILAALIDTGFYYWFSVNKVADLADIRKQSVAVWFGDIEKTLYQELGINPTPVSVPDTVAALNTGQISVNLAPAGWMLGMQAYQYSNYYIKPPICYSPGAVLISANTVDRLQKKLEVSKIYADNVLELLVSDVNAIEPEWNRQIRSYEEISLKAFESKCGMKVVTLPPEDQQAIQAAGKIVEQKLAGKLFPKELIDSIQKALADYRASR